MLLYRFAKMMEDHTNLKRTQPSSESGLEELRLQKEQIEEEILHTGGFAAESWEAAELQLQP